MTTKTRTPVLLRRHAKALADLKATADACNTLSSGTWLRRMAGVRRELAIIYRQAAARHHVDSIEWHGLQEAALMLELHAAANLSSAHVHDVRDASEKGDVA